MLKREAAGLSVLAIVSIIFAIYLLFLNAWIIFSSWQNFLVFSKLKDFIINRYTITTVAFLLFSFGLLRRLTWARYGMVVVCIYWIFDVIFLSAFLSAVKRYGIFDIRTVEDIIYLIYFFLVIFYLTRSKVAEQFKKG